MARPKPTRYTKTTLVFDNLTAHDSRTITIYPDGSLTLKASGVGGGTFTATAAEIFRLAETLKALTIKD